MRIRDFIFVFNLPFLSQMHCYWQTKSKLSTNFNTDSVTLNFTSNLVWILSHPKQGLNSVLCFTTCSFVLIKWFGECADCCYWSYGPFRGGIWVFQAGTILIQFPHLCFFGFLPHYSCMSKTSLYFVFLVFRILVSYRVFAGLFCLKHNSFSLSHGFELESVWVVILYLSLPN